MYIKTNILRNKMNILIKYSIETCICIPEFVEEHWKKLIKKWYFVIGSILTF